MGSEAAGAGTVGYWRKGEAIQNFGDFLTEYLLRHLFVGDLPRGHVVHLIGSVIDASRLKKRADAHAADLASGRPPAPGKVVFWGCGARDADGLRPEHRPHAEILAVRGPLTRAALGLSDAVPLGDPGLLLPELYQPRPAGPAQAVCVPHFLDRRDDAELLRRSGCAALLRTSIPASLAALEAVIDQLTGARFVLTASLHGAVVAAAYGRPFAFWDGGVVDVPFKWQDFAASLGIPCVFAGSLAEGEAVHAAQIGPALRLPPLWPLLAAAPLAVRPTVLVRVIAADLRRHGADVLHRPVATAGAEALLAAASGVPD